MGDPFLQMIGQDCRTIGVLNAQVGQLADALVFTKDLAGESPAFVIDRTHDAFAFCILIFAVYRVDARTHGRPSDGIRLKVLDVEAVAHEGGYRQIRKYQLVHVVIEFEGPATQRALVASPLPEPFLIGPVDHVGMATVGWKVIDNVLFAGTQLPDGPQRCAMDHAYVIALQGILDDDFPVRGNRSLEFVHVPVQSC